MWGFYCHSLPCLLSLFLHFQFVLSSSLNSASPSVPICSPQQSHALLQFKNTISIHSSASSHCDEYSYPKTNFWKNGSDCCSWDGVTCDSFTGNVIGLDLSSSWLVTSVFNNSSLFLLHNLQKLNLACNDFRESKIPAKFGELTELRHLDLSSSYFSGQIPAEIFHLSKLTTLDLSSKDLFGVLLELHQDDFNKLIQNLTELRYLHLDNVNMSSVAPSSLANLSSSLICLTLRRSFLYGDFPNDLFHFPFLQKLSLSANGLFGNLPISNWSNPLRFLDLSYTSFSGILPETIGNLFNLKELDLSVCRFNGSIPASLGNLTVLTALDLSFNNFTGRVPKSLLNLGKLTNLSLGNNRFFESIPDVFGNLSKLIHLDLSSNCFSGPLPSSAFNLTRLSVLDFSENQLDGQIPIQVSGLLHLTELQLYHNFLNGGIPTWLFTLPSLNILDLSENKLKGHIEEFQPFAPLQYVSLAGNEIQGPVPNAMFEFLNLSSLDLSVNNFSGILMSEMFQRLEKLRVIVLSYNSLLELAHNTLNFTLPNLWFFSFSHCSLTGFPYFLKNSRNLQYLDVSSNRIFGQITRHETELWSKLYFLNLSHNSFTSFEQNPSIVNLQYLDLRSNLLQGPLPFVPPSMILLSVANNKLSGLIPSWFCSLSSILYLELFNNSLSGPITQCLGNLGELWILNLGMNNFNGSIPQIFNSTRHIRYINLNGNKLEGPLPPLANCSWLEVFDVGNNMINDKFPEWRGNLPYLEVVVLRCNRFYGPIGDPGTSSAFSKLQILDLSYNQFTGNLPTRYFEKFQSMMQGDKNNVGLSYLESGFDSYYSIVFTLKGVDLDIERILITFIALDLSSNQFQGSIPEAIGKLDSLIVFNISHNKLKDYVPSLIGNLTQLESLDLSFNKLSGEIPNQLVNLLFLSVLNLSYNQFVGSIPQGNQFKTFSNDSFIGNPGLCGPPLSKTCNNDEPPSPITEDNAWRLFDWKTALMGYGCGLVLGISMGYIVFTTRKPQWFVQMVEQLQPITVRRLRGRRN